MSECTGVISDHDFQLASTGVEQVVHHHVLASTSASTNGVHNQSADPHMMATWVIVNVQHVVVTLCPPTDLLVDSNATAGRTGIARIVEANNTFRALDRLGGGLEGKVGA